MTLCVNIMHDAQNFHYITYPIEPLRTFYIGIYNLKNKKNM